MRRKKILFLVFVLVAMMLLPMPNVPMIPSDILHGIEQVNTYTPSSTNLVVAIQADSDDDWWQHTGSWQHNTANDFTSSTNSSSLRAWSEFRWPLSIPQGATIIAANVSLYETVDEGANDLLIERIDQTNCEDLEAASSKPDVNSTNSVVYDMDAGGWPANEWGPITDITDMLQDQVNLGGWTSGYYFGIQIRDPIEDVDYASRFEDYQAAGTNHAFLNITYTTGGGPEAPESDLNFYSYTIQSDGDDDYWNYNDTTWTHETTNTEIMCRQNTAIGEDVAQFRLQLDIPAGAIIHEAIMNVYELNDNGVMGTLVRRIDETDVGVLEADSSRPNFTEVNQAVQYFDKTAGDWEAIDVTYMVQDQVNLDGWTSGYHIGFQFNTTGSAVIWTSFEDYQAAGTNHAYITVTYTNSTDSSWLSGWQYRKSHVIRQTSGADVNYTLPLNISLGSGWDNNFTVYLSENARSDFGDIRFTSDNGTTLLNYNLSATYTEQETDYFSAVPVDWGAHYNFYPSAFYFNGRTYIAFQGDLDPSDDGLDIHIMYYDHSSDNWSGVYYVAYNLIQDIEPHDMHGSPTIWVDRLGYINIIYGSHVSAFKYARSVYPEDIRYWDLMPDPVADDATYPNVQYDANNNVIHLFYRASDGDDTNNIAYQNSTDYGVSWSVPQNIIEFTSSGDWPLTGISDFDISSQLLHLAVRYADHPVSPEVDYDVYYLYFNVTNGHCYNVTGSDLGVTVDETTEFIPYCLVRDSGSNEVAAQNVHVDSSGTPYIFYTEVNTIYFTYWTGSAWESPESITTGFSAHDFIVHDSDNITAFLADSGDIQRYTWDGNSWSWEEEIYDSDRTLAMTMVPFDHDNEIQVIFCEYQDVGDGYHSNIYAWGQNDLVNGVVSKYARFYVEIPFDLDMTDIVIYIYWGKSDEISISQNLILDIDPWVGHGRWGTDEIKRGFIYYVQNDESDLDSSEDVGFHSNFQNERAGPDSSYDTLTEENTAEESYDAYDQENSDIDSSADIGTQTDPTYANDSVNSQYMNIQEGNTDPAATNSENDVDNNASDVGAPTDVGTENNFAYAQGTSLDSSYMTLIEANQGIAGINEYKYVDGLAGAAIWSTTGATPYLSVQDQPTNFIYTTTNGLVSQWYTFAATSGTGSGFTVNCSLYWNAAADSYISSVEIDWTDDGVADWSTGTTTQTWAWDDLGTVTGLDTQAEIDAARIRFTYSKGAAGPDQLSIDAARLGISKTGTTDYELDFEYQWTTADYDETYEYVCIWVQTASQNGENLVVDYWSGSWTNLGTISSDGWNNFTATGLSGDTYTIRIYDSDQSNEGTQSTWSIDLITLHVYSDQSYNYALDFEYQWTDATYDAIDEMVCVYVQTATQGGETLQAWEWTGSAWSSLGLIDDDAWNNFTLSYLTSSTFYILINETDQTSDTTQNNWNIDLIVLMTSATAYELDLEAQWVSVLQYSYENEYLCIYTGSVNAENLSVDFWNGTGWQFLFNLTASSWNNISINDWLVSETFTIRYVDTIRDPDASEGSWQIDAALIWVYPSGNNPPVNYATPACTNLDDTDNIYALYKVYLITANVTDLNGEDDIKYVDLVLASDDRLTEYWTVQYNHESNEFTEKSDPSGYIELNISSSEYSASGEHVDMTFWITFNWNHPDLTDIDLRQVVMDMDSSTDSDWYEVDYDVETRLDHSTGPTLSDGTGTADRGNIDGSMTASGTIIYYGGSTHPYADDIDLWISAPEYGTQTGPWQATNLANDGTYSHTVYADDVVGLDTYTFKAVVDGAGSGGSDLFESTQTDDYIADQIVVQTTVVDDSRLNVNDNAEIRVTLWLDYDDSYLGSGDTVTLNDTAMSWDAGNSWFELTRMQTTVGLWLYFVNSSSETTHGVTSLDVNSQEVSVIWDRIIVVSYSVSDGRVNVDDNVNIDATLQYEYDSTAVTDGTVTINGSSAAHQGSGVWRIVDSKSTVTDHIYNIVACSGNTYGITLVDQNGQSTTVIWDRIIILTTAATDGRIDYGTSTTINVTAQLEYDSHALGSGDTLYMNDTSMTWNTDHFYLTTGSYSIVDLINYFVNSSNANEATYGITLINLDSNDADVIWDRIIILTTVADDGRINYGTSTTINVTAQLEYDSHGLGAADTLYMNDTSMTWDTDHFYLTTGSYNIIELINYFVNSSNANEATYTITVVSLDGNDADVIWDRVQVQSYTVSDNHDNINDDVTIDVTLWYDYDDTLVTDGTVTINTIGAAHQGSGVWRITENEATVQQKTYDTVACSGNTHGITVVDQNGQSDSVIWDQIVVQTTVVDDSRLDVDANAEIRVTLWLDYADEYLGSGDTVTLDDTAMSWDSGNSWFELSRTKASVGLWNYFVNSSSEATYGITALDVNSQNQDVIWDRIIILTTTTDDGRIDISTAAALAVTAQLEYDSHALGSGDTLYMNDTSMSWNTTHFTLAPNFAQVGLWNFFVNSSSANEATYGITVINLDGKNIDEIWDRLIIDMQADDETMDNGHQVNFTLTVTFDYDSVTCTTYLIVIDRNLTWWHSFDNSNKSSFVDTNSDTTYNYTAHQVTSESTYGITAYTTNLETVVWSGAPPSNVAPANDTQPTSADLHDTDNLYAYIVYYSIIAYVSDGDGFADIDYLEISCYSNDQITLYWTVRYDEDTDTFSEQFDPSDYIYLDTGASSAVETGNDIDATFEIRINWNHPDITDTDFKCYVIDDEPESDTDFYENDWDYETRLDYSVAPSVTSDDAGTVDRGDLDETFHITGTIIYYGGSVSPTTAIVDVWISGSEYGASAGPWSDLTLTAGAFDITCYADDAVGQDTYTIKVVLEGAGSGGTDQYYTTSVTDTYIADKIQVQTTVADDTRLDISTASQIRVTLWLSYDATYLGSGDTVILNDTAMSWDVGNSWFELSRSQSTVGLWKYFVNSSIESSHGITGLDLNSNDVSVIWDSLTISLSNPSDQRIDISTSLSGMVASATYDYDSAAYDGTLVLNNSQYSYGSAQRQGYKVNSASGDDSYGITAISSNTDETYCIWDSLTTYISPPTDQRININANASGMVVWAIYDYDSAAYDGALSLNDETYDHSTVANYTYYVNVGDGDDSYGITAVSSYNETWCIFDRLMITITPDDSDVENGVQVNFTLAVRFDYDDVTCTTYVVQVTRDAVYWHSFINANKTLFKDTNEGVSYEYTVSLVPTESTYDITAFSVIPKTVTWSVAGGGGVGELMEPERQVSFATIFVGMFLFGLLSVSIIAYVTLPSKKSVYKQMKGVIH